MTIYDTGGYIGELAGSLTGVYSYTHEERSQLYRGFVHSVEEDRRGEYIFQMIANMVSFGVPSLLDTGIRHGVGSEEFGEGVGSSVISAGISYGSVRASGGNLYTSRQPLVRGRVQEGPGYQPRRPVEGPGYQPQGSVEGSGYQPGGSAVPCPPTAVAPKTPAEIAREVAGPRQSARAAVEALNKQSLPQNQVIEILTQVFRQSGRDIAGVQVQANGTQIMLSRVVGTRQPVIAVNAQGKATFGLADIQMSTTPPFIRATNIQLPEGF